MIEFKIIGDISNWMDFRDKLIEVLENCDTKLKLDRIINGILLSVGGIESIQEARKRMGIKELTKGEIKDLEKRTKC